MKNIDDFIINLIEATIKLTPNKIPVGRRDRENHPEVKMRARLRAQGLSDDEIRKQLRVYRGGWRSNRVVPH